MQSRPAGNFIDFSTDGMSEQDALPHWRELYGRFILKLDIRPVGGHPFRQTTRLQALPDLNIARGVTSAISAHRTQTLTADGNDDFLFIVNLNGQSVLSCPGRELDLNAGQATLISNANVGSGLFPRAMDYLAVRIPRSVLADRIKGPEGAMLRMVAEDNSALRLLVDYVATGMDAHSPLNPGLQPAFATHVHDLVALALGATTRDGAMLAQGRGVRAARLAAIKADILAHLREEGLSVQDIARRHGVTPRYVQLLFDTDGQTFSEFVVEQRLVRARQMLTEERFAGWTISAIAYEVGFSNLSYFNRTFLRRYSATPSDVREAARKDKG
jgi:AraC-like DNA-binding protein